MVGGAPDARSFIRAFIRAEVYCALEDVFEELRWHPYSLWPSEDWAVGAPMAQWPGGRNIRSSSRFPRESGAQPFRCGARFRTAPDTVCRRL